MGDQIRLTDEEIAEVVQRAHEIHALERRFEEQGSEIDQYVQVAEEMGVPREAMVQALGERFVFLEEHLEVGQLVFAKSGDGHSYVARVDGVFESRAQVRFLNGSDASVGLHELQRASFTPGSPVEYFSKEYGMNVRGRCVSYNKDGHTLTVSTWGEEHTVPLEKVRLRGPRAPLPFKENLIWILAGASLLVGGGVGALVMYFVMR